jgi:transglutaminase-like putative cysteine protease
MLYDLTLRIDYAFGGEGARGRQVLRLLPKSIESQQRVIAAALDMAPRPSERRDSVDFFGNHLVETAHETAGPRMTFTVKARIRRLVHASMLDLSPKLRVLPAAIARHADLGWRSPHHFTGPSPRIQPDAAIATYARDHVRAGMTGLEAVRC